MFGRLKVLTFGLVAVLLSGVYGTAQPADEKLLFVLPKGFKLGFQDNAQQRQMKEFVPHDETFENWTEMVTTRIFHALATMRPIEFERKMLLSLKKSCPSAEAAHVVDGVENGYAFSIWIEKFCVDVATRQTETTYFKAIQGISGLYVVQKSFKAPLTKERALDATQFLRIVQLCDTSNVDHPCPASKTPRKAVGAPV